MQSLLCQIRPVFKGLEVSFAGDGPGLPIEQSLANEASARASHYYRQSRSIALRHFAVHRRHLLQRARPGRSQRDGPVPPAQAPHPAQADVWTLWRDASLV